MRQKRLLPRKTSFVECRPVLVFIALAMLFSAEVFAMDTPVGDLDIYSSTKYRVQWSNSPDKAMVPNDSSDQDFYQLLGLDWNIADSGFTFHFLGKYSKDLDGTPEGSIFQDYIDTWDERQLFNPYYAYIEKMDILPSIDMRLGRQYAYGAETVQFDGLWVRANNIYNFFSVEGYGGMPVQTYLDLNRDGIGGVNLEVYPMKNLIVHLDSTFYKENSVELWADWRMADFANMDAHWAWNNFRNDYISLGFSGEVHKTGTTIELSFYTNFKNNTIQEFIFDYQSPEVDLGNDIKRFYLQREQGYYHSIISISQEVPGIEGVACFFRYARRDLMNRDDENLYNTDFQSFTTGVNLNDIFHLHGFHFSFGYTRWWEDRATQANGRKMYEAVSDSWFIDFSQRFLERFEIAAGLYFKDEDVNAMIEGEAAHHYYGALKYEVFHAAWAELKYEYERDDYYKEFGISDINSLTASFNVRF
jgi:hypothetical protein